MTLTKMLLPERWLVQPKVVPMHVLREPERRRTPSVIAEREARSISTYAVAPYIDKRRMAAVSVKVPEEIGLDILRFIVLAGDRRYWSWSARKQSAKGNVRRSLAEEMCIDKDNLNRAVRGLLADSLVEIGERQNGQEVMRITETGKGFLAEVKWRWFMRECAPEFLQPMADNYGWQEISLQVDRRIVVEEMEHSRRADVIAAAKEQLRDGVEATEGRCNARSQPW